MSKHFSVQKCTLYGAPIRAFPGCSMDSMDITIRHLHRDRAQRNHWKDGPCVWDVSKEHSLVVFHLKPLSVVLTGVDFENVERDMVELLHHPFCLSLPNGNFHTF